MNKKITFALFMAAIAATSVANAQLKVGSPAGAPTSTLQVAGSMGTNYTILTASTTLDNTHSVVLANQVSGAITLTLPAASTCTGRQYTIQNNQSGVTTLTGGGGVEAADLVLNQVGQTVVIVAGGSTWQLISNSIKSTTTPATAGNIYTTDGALAGVRTVAQGANTLNFTSTVNGNAQTLLNPAMTSGYIGSQYGKSSSTNNSAEVRYHHIADGDPTNRIEMGLYNKLGLLNILANGNIGVGTTAPISKLHIVADNNSPNGIVNIESYTNPIQIRGRRANGTQAAPTASGQGNNLMVVGGTGYTGTAFGADNAGAMVITASDTWTATSTPTAISLNVTAPNTIVPAVAAYISPEGNVGIGTTAPGGLLEVGNGAGAAYANPVVRVHSSANVNGSGGQIQFRESDVNYGFNIRHNTNAATGFAEGLNIENVNAGVATTNFTMDQVSGNIGIKNPAPASTLQVNGSFGANYNTITAATYTMAANDYYVVYNGTTASTVTLPAAVAGAGNYKGRLYTIKNTTAAQTLNVTAATGESIDGTASFVVAPGNSIQIVSTGATTGPTWEVVNFAATTTSTGTTLYTGDGSLSGNRTVTMGASNLNFNSTSGQTSFISNNNALNRTTFQNTNTGASNRADINITSGTSVGVQLGVENGSTVFGVGTKGYLDNRSGGRMVFGTSGNEHLTIATGGNIGLATSTPLSHLSVVNDGGGSGAGDDMELSTFGSSTSPTFFIKSSGGTVAAPTNIANGINLGNISWTGRVNAVTNSTLSFVQSTYTGDGTTALSNLQFGTSNGERMRIDASGNVGIGTTSPGARLEVNGNVKITPAAASQGFSQNANGIFGIDASGVTNGRFVVLENGNVGVGIAAPAAKLHLYEATGTAASTTTGSLVLEHNNAGGASSIVFKSKNNGGSDFGSIQFQDDATIGGSGESSRLIIGNQNDGDDHIVLNPSGNVMISTTAADVPTAKLDVNGTARIRTINAAAAGTLTSPLVVDGSGNVLKATTGAANATVVWTPTLTSGATADYTLPSNGVWEADVTKTNGCGYSSYAKVLVAVTDFNNAYSITNEFSVFSTDGTVVTPTRGTNGLRANSTLDYVFGGACADGSTGKTVDFTLSVLSTGSPRTFRFTNTATGTASYTPTIIFRKLSN